MSIHHLTIDDTRTWLQPSDRQVFIGDVLDLATSATTRIRFCRYGKGAVHEWMVTVDETLIVTKGALLVRSEGEVQIARAGEVVSLAKGSRVVYRGEEDDTEVVFVSYAPSLEVQRHVGRRTLNIDDGRMLRGVRRLVRSLSVPPEEVRKGA
jgi:ethanolamine utilization protein EutQ (cupin superfamily)